MTLPRQLSLRTTSSGELKLHSLPVRELQVLRKSHYHLTNVVIVGTSEGVNTEVTSEGMFELMVEFDLKDDSTAREFGIILENSETDNCVIGYNTEMNMLLVDRRKSGAVDFDADFARSIHTAPLAQKSDGLKLHIFVDWSSIEIFAEDGQVILTSLVLPKNPYNKILFYAEEGAVRVKNLDIWALKSIWRE
jgi:sucrose-6-phosphate hydrolase SacC (GH32 family)